MGLVLGWDQSATVIHLSQGFRPWLPGIRMGQLLLCSEQGVRHHWQVLDKYQCLLLVISEQIPVIGPITV